MDLKLKNKKALVTGSTAGIGLAIASSLLKEGASVIINGRSKGRIEQAIALLSDDDMLARFKQAAYEQAQQYDISNIVPVYEKLYGRFCRMECLAE